MGEDAVGMTEDVVAFTCDITVYPRTWLDFPLPENVVNVYVPNDRVTGAHQGYGFVEFRSEEDADYAIKVLNMIKLHGKTIRVNKASQDKKSVDVGANLFIGNLDPMMRDPETGNSRGFSFISYDSFDAFDGNSRGFSFISYDSFDAFDAAIETMNGQYLCNRQITVSCAYKKDTKGERHDTPAERYNCKQDTDLWPEECRTSMNYNCQD